MRMRVTGRHEHVETVVAEVYTNHERQESRIEVQRMQAHRGRPPRKLTSIPITEHNHTTTSNSRHTAS